MEAQQGLPFGLAEASHAERRQQLALALQAMDCDLYLAKFCEFVFNLTHGGIEGEVTKSYDEIRSRPWGLCCGKTKARNTVDLAVHYGIVRRIEQRYVSFGQKANSYTIDWEGVARILRGERPLRKAAATMDGGADAAGIDGADTVSPDDRPGAATRHPHAATRHPHAATRHPFKEQESLPNSYSPGPDPERPEPRPGYLKFVIDDETRRLPEVAALLDVPIAPLPAERVAYGVWSTLSDPQLAHAKPLAEWFRRQQSIERPVCGNSAAHLLLVFCAGYHAGVHVPAGEIRKSRTGFFVTIVGKQLWVKVRQHIPAVIDKLDAWLAHNPDAIVAQATASEARAS